MAMFGNRRLPKINPALGQAMMAEQGIMPGDRPRLPEMPQLPGRKPGMFGQGGAGRAIAGTIGDVLLQHNDMAPIYAPARQQAQQMAEAMRAKSLERDADWQDWVKKREYERANPGPSSLQYFDDNAGNRYSYDPATGKQALIFTDPNDKMFVQDGQLVTVPNRVRGDLASGGEQRQTIGGKTYVKRGNDWFEEGGPASAPGGFPR